MTDEKEIRLWLRNNYPQLSLRRGPNGRFGIWQENVSYDVYELSDGDSIAYQKIGYNLVFAIECRLLGGWVKDEIQRRDPRLWHRPGNAFHDAFLASKEAEREYEKRCAARRESGENMWKVVKHNDALMNRIARRMAIGDLKGAARELSPEQLFRNAKIENPRELRSRDFWKAISDVGRSV